MEFTPWSVFVDLAVVALLLLLGQLARVRFVFVQKLFLPANVLAGAGGLLLGPNGLGLLPLSSAIGTYPGILIALIFAALPFASGGLTVKSNRRGLGELWAYSSATMLLQWGLGLLFALVLLRAVWPGLNRGFGAVLASGFVGGHGTAAAVGQAFAERGWDEAGSLAMTSATIGILSAIVGGMIWIKWASQRGATRFVTSFNELPQELRTGLVPAEKRGSMGRETLSPISLDPLVFHLALIAAAAGLGYFVGQSSAAWLGKWRLPTFCLAFLCAALAKQAMKATGALSYVDRTTTVRVCGSLTDLLVAFGIASIKIPILLAYAFPLGALFAFGLLLCWALFRLVGPRAFRDMWFEKTLYTWGWVTGIMAMAIALLRIVDPDNESGVLDDFALAYLAIGPVEVALVALGPVLISQGHHWLFAGVTAGLGLLIVIALLTGRRRTQ